MTWAGFLGVFALFFATHSIPVQPAVKSQLISRFGARGFALGYSVLSIAMLALLIWSAGQAPQIELWPQTAWQRHAVHLGMLGACLILALSIARPNPFSFGGAHNDRFDPARPGIVRLVRHPVLAALALWAGAHILPNGDLAHLLLFGVLGGFAIAGRRVIDRRKQRQMGAQSWDQLNCAVAQAPLLTGPGSLPATALRLAIGIGIFIALLKFHPLVIGVSAL